MKYGVAWSPLLWPCDVHAADATHSHPVRWYALTTRIRLARRCQRDASPAVVRCDYNAAGGVLGGGVTQQRVQHLHGCHEDHHASDTQGR
jgi:hypothetical protein